MLPLLAHLKALYMRLEHAYTHHEVFRLVTRLAVVTVALTSNFLWSIVLWYLTSMRADWGRRGTLGTVDRAVKGCGAVGLTFLAVRQDFILDREEQERNVPLHWIRSFAAAKPHLVALMFSVVAVYLFLLLAVNMFFICTALRSKPWRASSRASAFTRLAHLSVQYESALGLQREADQLQQSRRARLSSSHHEKSYADWLSTRHHLVETWQPMMGSDELLYHAWRSHWWVQPSATTRTVIPDTLPILRDFLRDELNHRPSFQAMQSHEAWAERLMDSQHSIGLQAFASGFAPFLRFVPPADGSSESAGKPLQDAVKAFEDEEWRLNTLHRLPGQASFVKELRLATARPEAVEDKLFEAILDEVLAARRSSRLNIVHV
ncbi:hypothetical protein JCM8097_006479 [Rhodosporidiobolus ruineniae]